MYFAAKSSTLSRREGIRSEARASSSPPAVSPPAVAVDRRQFLGGRWRKAVAVPSASATPPLLIEVLAHPEHLAATSALIATLDGARVGASTARGRIAVTAEAAKADAVLLALNHMPHVLSAAFVTVAGESTP